MTKTWLMTPGPVPISPQVLNVLSEPALHHRTPTFEKILGETLLLLREIFQTSKPCFILTSTGSGAMEAALVNTLSVGDQVLSIVGGKFGERWADMAEVFGAKVDRFKVEWGQPLDLEKFQTHLNSKAYDLVLCQACETSTGQLFPIKEIGEMIKSTQALFLVDAITALGCVELPMDKWNLDVVVGGSQKAFQLPTGLSFISLSDKASNKQKLSNCPRYYFDLARELKANLQNQTFFSSPVSLIKGLHVFLLGMRAEGGVEALIRLHSLRAHSFRSALSHLGFNFFPTNPSDSLSVVSLPKDVEGKSLRLALEQKGLIAMGGQDQLEGKVLRFGHMGYMTPQDLWGAIKCLYRNSPWLVSDKNSQQIDARLLEAQTIFESQWKSQ